MTRFLDVIVSGTGEGLLWAVLAIGVYISYRVLDFADLSVDGSIVTGAAVTAVFIVRLNVNPILATLIAIVAGALAGLLTSILHTKCKIAPILSGILTMTALYSINIHIMGSSSLAILGQSTVLDYIKDLFSLNTRYATLVLGVLVVAVVIGILYLFFGTQIGSAIRATGNNERMCRAQGINTDNTKIIGMMISNALVAFSGSLLLQCSWYTSNYSYGVGAIVIGLASVIIGETIFFRARSFWVKLISVAVGSIIYRVIITAIINFNLMDSSDLKLFSSIVVALALSIPAVKKFFSDFIKKRKNKRYMPEEVKQALQESGKEGQDA